jgi:Cdc6-like AAA superfamily ATPase
MIYTREEHFQFLEEELRAQTEEFRKKLDTKATFLLQEKNELFIAQFITFRLNGEMLLKFPNTRSLPRKGDYLFCFTVPKELRNYRNWGDMTYGDLLKQHNNHSEGICIWHQKDKMDDRFSIVGFRGIDIEFAQNIAPAQFVDDTTDGSDLPATPVNSIERKDGIILLLGPNKPPFEYLVNLQKIVQKSDIEPVRRILDHNFISCDNDPVLLDSKKNISNFILSQLAFNETFILQGPPGTGKTYLIAQICEKLAEQGESVLVTALTNRALMEVAEKPMLEQMLKRGEIYKTNLSTNETREVKNLKPIKDIVPMPGQLILSTFYSASKAAAEATGQHFDYVIVDEASQAFLSTLAMSKILGKKTLWVGDCKQLPPIILINEDRINARQWNLLSDGFLAMTEYISNPSYQLTESYRLTERATQYTGCFYNNTLKSKSDSSVRLSYDMPFEISKFFNPNGGPVLIKTDLNVGESKPQFAILLATVLTAALLKVDKDLHIAILTKKIVTVQALQKAISPLAGNNKRIIVETVDRVQGLTTDITIYVIPNTSYSYSLEKRLFNVATSRAKRHTVIIADKDILNHSHINNDVKNYLKRLDEEFSFYIQPEQDVRLLKR